MASTRWNTVADSPNWVRDASGRLLGYRDERGNFFELPNTPASEPTDASEPLSAIGYNPATNTIPQAQAQIVSDAVYLKGKNKAAGMEPFGFPLATATMALAGDTTPTRQTVTTVDGLAERITGTTAGGTVSITMTLPRPVRVVDAALFFASASTQDSVGVYFGDSAGFSNAIRRTVYVGNSNGRSSNNGAVLCANHVGHGDFSWEVDGTVTENTLMTHMRLYIVPNAGQMAEITLSRILLNTASRARIAITCDDGWASWYQYAIPELDKRGLRSTMAVIPTTVGLSNVMTLAELRNARDMGHEIIAHGVNELAYGGNLYDNPVLTTDALRLADIQSSISTIDGWGLYTNDRQKQCYVWPGGIWQQARGDSGLLDLCHGAGIRYARAVTHTVPTSIAAHRNSRYSNMTLPIIGHIRGANRSAEDTNITNIAAQIAHCADYGLDGVLMFHKVIADQATYSTVTDNDISIERGQFNLILDAIDAERAAGRLDVVTFSELFI